VKQSHARLVGAKLGQIQQRVESKPGRITSMAALHHHWHHSSSSSLATPAVTASHCTRGLFAGRHLDTRRTGAKPGQLGMLLAANSLAMSYLCSSVLCAITKLTEM